jgi:predicted 2-oxoglutarate/Fe(II)-dependent dioxygenase YbiX
MKTLSDYIVVIENAVTPALCDAVLNEYKNCNDWVNAVVKNGENLNIRNCQTIGISFNSVIEKNQEIRKKIDAYLFVSASGVIKKYNKKFVSCNIEQDSGYDLLKYEVGDFYTTHTDSFKDRPRTVSCSFILNDDYEGGEFAFFDRELVYNLKKGSCIMFPSNFMYPHEIMPVTSGTRYSIVTWFV